MDGLHNFSGSALDRSATAHSFAWPKLIGVAGGRGRTTTSYLIPSVLAAGGCPTGVHGSLGMFDGCRWAAAGRYADASGFAAWMANLTANGCSHGVVEFRGHATNNLALDIACFTDSGAAHFAPGMQNGSPADVAALLDRLAPEGFAIVDADGAAADELLQQIDGPVLTIGMTRAAEITAAVIERWPSEQTFLLSSENETIPVRTRLGGDESVRNCLMAAAVGTIYGIDLPTIVRGLEAIERMPGDADQWEQTTLNRAA